MRLTFAVRIHSEYCYSDQMFILSEVAFKIGLGCATVN